MSNKREDLMYQMWSGFTTCQGSATQNMLNKNDNLTVMTANCFILKGLTKFRSLYRKVEGALNWMYYLGLLVGMELKYILLESLKCYNNIPALLLTFFFNVVSLGHFSMYIFPSVLNACQSPWCLIPVWPGGGMRDFGVLSLRQLPSTAQTKVMSSVKSNIFSMDSLRLIRSSHDVFCEESCQASMNFARGADLIWVLVCYIKIHGCIVVGLFPSEPASIAFRKLFAQYGTLVAVSKFQSYCLCTIIIPQTDFGKKLRNCHLEMDLRGFYTKAAVV